MVIALIGEVLHPHAFMTRGWRHRTKQAPTDTGSAQDVQTDFWESPGR